MRKRLNKKVAQSKHFERRCIERVGVALNQNEIIRQIQNNELTVIGKQTNGVTLFQLERLGKFFKVAYDKNRKQVVTIMPEDVCKN